MATSFTEDIEHGNLNPEATGLPPLDSRRERDRLVKARNQRMFESAWSEQRPRFSWEWAANQDDFLTNAARFAQARRTVRAELNAGQHVKHVLPEIGYILVHDLWRTEGRRVCWNEEPVHELSLYALAQALTAFGWQPEEAGGPLFENAFGELLLVEISKLGHLLHQTQGDR